jgi:outer membrane protein TolC
MGGVITFFWLPTWTVLAQSAPVSPDRPWHISAELSVEADAKNIPDLRFTLDPAKTYSLPELVDLAEAHNPATRVSWERARVQAAALGVARSELYPTLAAAALSQTTREEVLFGNRILTTPFLTSGLAPVESTPRKRRFWQLILPLTTPTVMSFTRCNRLSTAC